MSFQELLAPVVSTIYAKNSFVLRSTASTSGLNWGNVGKGSALVLCTQTLDAKGNVWYMVKTTDGRSGWVIGNDVSFQVIT